MSIRERLSRRRREPVWRNPGLPLPPGVTEQELLALVSSIRVEDGPSEELEGYWREAFGRFVRTLNLAAPLTGSALELGANPYFLTILLRSFTSLDVTLANYFGSDSDGAGSQSVTYRSAEGDDVTTTMSFHVFDAENDAFPFAHGSFDVVLYCEVIEHMTQDPLATLRKINRVLTPHGHLILTTPNVGRLENLARLVRGENLYDPYSGYGPHGRHNREYNPHELGLLLDYAGFDIEVIHSADSHPPIDHYVAVVDSLNGIGPDRARDLGQYIFVRARRRDEGRPQRPSFLYRSFPPGEIEDFPPPVTPST